MNASEGFTGNTKRFNVPLSHLEPEYIEKCTDVKELEKIYRILQAGDEGYFPHLERSCEERLTALNPNSRVLRKDSKICTKGDLDKEEWQEIDNDLKDWSSDMKYMEDSLKKTSQAVEVEEDSNLPPIRTGSITLTAEGAKSSKQDPPKNKRVKPREYREWDKIDVDKELEKIDNPEKKEAQARTIVSGRDIKNISDSVDSKGLTDAEKLMKANREKDKGNEAFKANDFKEAILYYSRSISLQPTAASYNNRALAYLKSSDWIKAITDCNTVLKMEPGNIKALLRRGTAYKGNKQYQQARGDLKVVLEKEPNNKRAMELLDDVDKIEQKEKEERKTKGRRMVIEDVEGSESEEEVAENKTSKPALNGQAETAEELKPRRKMVIEDVSGDEEEEGEEQKRDMGKVNGTLNRKDSKEKESKPETEKLKKSVSDKKVSKDIWEADEVVNDKLQKQNSSAQETVKDSTKHDEKNGESVNSKVLTEETENKETETTDVSSSNSESPVMVVENQDNLINGKIESEKQESSEEKEDHFKRPVFIQKALPANVAKLKVTGNNLFKNGQYGDACEKYSTVIESLKSDPDQTYNLSLMYSNRSACYLKIGDLPAAVKDCNNSLQLVPHSVKPLLRRASAYEHLERYNLAYIDYRHTLLLDSSVEQAHLGTKRCQSMLNGKDGPRWREKIKLPQVSMWEIPEIIDESGKSLNPPQPAYIPTKAPEVTPSNEMPAVAPSNKTSTSQSSESDSSVTAETIIKQEPEVKKKEVSPQEKFDALKAEGNDFVKKGDFRAAIKCYTQCIDMLPDQMVSYTNRALCHLRLSQPSEAEADCSKVLSVESGNIKALFRRGQARKMLKQYREGIEDLKHLLELDPNNTAAKKEMELLKNYWRQELNDMKKDMKSSPAKAKDSGEKPSSKNKPEEKPRKKLVIQEIESEEDEKEIKTGSGKVSPQEFPKSKSTEASKQKDVKSSQAQSKKDSAPVQNKSDKKSKKGKQKTVKETSSGLPKAPPSVPKLEKATPYEFISTWNSLKSSQSVQSYYDVLKQITPSDIPTVISNKLDGQMLNVIVRCVAEHYLQNGEEDESYQILEKLSTVPRFSTISMFMSGKDKECVKTVMNKLEQHSSSVYTAADVKKLCKTYSV